MQGEKWFSHQAVGRELSRMHSAALREAGQGQNEDSDGIVSTAPHLGAHNRQHGGANRNMDTVHVNYNAYKGTRLVQFA